MKHKMKRVFKFALSIVGLLVVTLGQATAGIIYDNGTPSRPLIVTGLSLQNGLFDATFNYDILFGDSVIDPQAITGSNDEEIAAALLAQLNNSPVFETGDVRATLAFFVVHASSPVYGGIPFPEYYQASGIGASYHSEGELEVALENFENGIGDWDIVGQYAPGYGGEDILTLQNNFALISFSPSAGEPVPEPSSLILLGTGAVGLLGYRLRRKRK